MKVVKVFVRCELAQMENILDILKNKGLSVEHCVQPDIIIGTIGESKISELRDIDGVLGVWEGLRFYPFK